MRLTLDGLQPMAETELTDKIKHWYDMISGYFEDISQQTGTTPLQLIRDAAGLLTSMLVLVLASLRARAKEAQSISAYIMSKDQDEALVIKNQCNINKGEIRSTTASDIESR